VTRLQLPAAARATVDQLAAALTPRLDGCGETPAAAAGRIAAVLADLQEVATALHTAVARSGVGDTADVRGLREIRRELLQVMRELAPLAAAKRDDAGDTVPRTRHLRAASLLPSPPPGAMALERLLEVLVHRRSGAGVGAGLSRAERVRGAAQDLRVAAAVLHRLEPRPAGRVIAQLAALAVDLHRIAGGLDRSVTGDPRVSCNPLPRKGGRRSLGLHESPETHASHESHEIQEPQRIQQIQAIHGTRETPTAREEGAEPG
jgi:hypothetical protein